MKQSIALGCLIVPCLTVLGCAEEQSRPENNWVNTNLDSSRQQQQLATDRDQCTEIAASLVPAPRLLPPLQSPSPQPYGVPGAGIQGSEEARISSYNSQQIVDAQRAKSNAFDRCMEQRGWQRG